ncbi:hypothetical protein P389DRAFT_50654 [Cystobasidium minutum MCA 4210]|uniref:uncharacterized protein n=1 Tax=Cystobasidium minutum MCA 4210 TaxID=1397322 RepID=UPI0034CF66F5|eukprot:jgi/Rhomi1/50654/CE50653_1114
MATVADHLAVQDDMRVYITHQSILFGIVLWDWLVCLGAEYKYVWTGKRSAVKVLYILSRYVSLILTTIVFSLNYLDQPASTCNVLVRFNCAAITLIQAISMAVLAQRAYYVSLRSKIVVFVLLLFIAAMMGLGLTHAIVAVESAPAAALAAHGHCRVQGRPHWKALNAAFFGLPLVGHAIATGFVVFHTRRHLTHNGNLRRLLVQDGILYLLAVEAVGILQLIFFLGSDNRQLAMMNAAALLSLTSVFCCRL